MGFVSKGRTASEIKQIGDLFDFRQRIQTFIASAYDAELIKLCDPNPEVLNLATFHNWLAGIHSAYPGVPKPSFEHWQMYAVSKLYSGSSVHEIHAMNVRQRIVDVLDEQIEYINR